ncbi:MAG: hypothetical protein ACXVJW_04730 [Acidimicrobiia bacterium]
MTEKESHMLVARYQGDKNLDQLAERLFELTGDASRKRVARDIAHSNRHLPQRRNQLLANAVPVGAVIAVPDTPGATPRDTVTALADEVAAATLTRVREAIRVAIPMLDARRQQSIDRATKTREVLESVEFSAAAEEVPALGAVAERLAEQRKEQIDLVERLATAQEVSVEIFRNTVRTLLEVAQRNS